MTASSATVRRRVRFVLTVGVSCCTKQFRSGVNKRGRKTPYCLSFFPIFSFLICWQISANDLNGSFYRNIMPSWLSIYPYRRLFDKLDPQNCWFFNHSRRLRKTGSKLLMIHLLVLIHGEQYSTILCVVHLVVVQNFTVPNALLRLPPSFHWTCPLQHSTVLLLGTVQISGSRSRRTEQVVLVVGVDYSTGALYSIRALQCVNLPIELESNEQYCTPTADQRSVQSSVHCCTQLYWSVLYVGPYVQP